VAVADVNDDGVADIITAAGPTGGPQVQVIDGTKLNQKLANRVIAPSALLASFFADAPTYKGGLFVAAANLFGTGIDIVVGNGTGSLVQVIDSTKAGNGTNQLNGQVNPNAIIGSFLAYPSSFTGGVTVAAIGALGKSPAEIVTAPGSGPAQKVKVIDPTKLIKSPTTEIPDTSLLGSFFAYGSTYTGGVFISVGDITNDGFVDIITGKPGRPSVHVYDGSTLPNPTLLYNFLAYAPTFTGGVRVGVVQINGQAQIILAAGPGPAQKIKIADSSKLANITPNTVMGAPDQLDNFLAFGASTAGAFVPDSPITW
jgi:hypothetical protein